MSKIAVQTNGGSDFVALITSVIDNFDVFTHTTTKIVLADSVGNQSIIITGTGFTVDSEDNVTGGTATSIQLRQSGAAYTKIFDFSIDAVTLADNLLNGTPDAALSLLGDTTFTGKAGNDRGQTGSGNDTLSGIGGADTLVGGDGGDQLNGGAGSDTASYETALAGVHASLANSASNTGDADGDSYSLIENLTGSGFVDKLTGNARANVLTGGNGNDQLLGRGGQDTLDGGDGNDRLTGGADRDTLTGGIGADRFIYNSITEAAAALGNSDTITDWAGNDFIVVNAASFGGGLVAGAALTDDQFRVNSVAIGENGQFLYNTFADALLWDADGSGSGSGVVVLHFATNENLNSGDILVV